MQAELQVRHSSAHTCSLTLSPAQQTHKGTEVSSDFVLSAIFQQFPRRWWVLFFSLGSLKHFPGTGHSAKELRLDLLPHPVNVLSNCSHKSVFPWDFTPAVEFCAAIFPVQYTCEILALLLCFSLLKLCYGAAWKMRNALIVITPSAPNSAVTYTLFL